MINAVTNNVFSLTPPQELGKTLKTTKGSPLALKGSSKGRVHRLVTWMPLTTPLAFRRSTLCLGNSKTTDRPSCVPKTPIISSSSLYCCNTNWRNLKWSLKDQCQGRHPLSMSNSPIRTTGSHRLKRMRGSMVTLTLRCSCRFLRWKTVNVYLYLNFWIGFDTRISLRDNQKTLDSKVKVGFGQPSMRTAGNRYITKKQEELELGIQKNSQKKGLMLCNLMAQKSN